MSNAFIRNRNKVLFEALMNPKFHKDKKNFVLKEIDFLSATDRISQKSIKDLNLPDIDQEKLKKVQEIFGHTALDVVGFFDPEPATDLINALWYFLRDEYFDCIMSIISAFIPYLGDLAAKSVKYSWKLAKVTTISIPIFKKAIAEISELLLKHGDEIYGVVSRMRSAGGKNPKLIAFLDWISSRLKNFKKYDEALQALEHTKEKDVEVLMAMTEDFFGPKSIDSLWRFFGRQGPTHYLSIIEGFLNKPKWIVLLEAYFLYGLLSAKEKQLFEMQMLSILKQLSLIDQEYSDISNKTLVQIGDPSKLSYELKYADLADSIKVLYILEACGKNEKLAGYVLSKISISSPQGTDVGNFINGALNKNFITKQQAEKIWASYKEFSKPVEETTIQKMKKEFLKYTPDQIKDTYEGFANSIKEFLVKAQQHQINAKLAKEKIQREYLPSIEKAASLRAKATDIPPEQFINKPPASVDMENKPK